MTRSLTIIYEEDDKKLIAHGGIPDEVPSLIEESKFNSDTLIYDDILKVVGQSMLEKIIELEALKKLKDEVIIRTSDHKPVGVINGNSY